MGYFRFIMVFTAFFSTVITNGQQYNKDSIQSLITQIRTTRLDTGHIRKLREVAYDIGENDSTLSKQLLDEAVSKSFIINDASAISNSYRLLGLWHRGMKENEKALECYRVSLKTAIKNKLYYLEAGAYFEISTIKYEQGEYDSCIDYCLKTQKIFEDPKVFEYKTLTKKILDKKKSDLYFSISQVFNTLKNLPKADEYIDKALAIAESYKNDRVIAIYMQQKADNYSANGQSEKALRIRLKHLTNLENKIVPKTLLQTSYQNIAEEFFELGKIDSSKIFTKKSLAIAVQLEVPDAVPFANLQMVKIALKEKQYAIAEAYLAKSSNYFLHSNDPVHKRSYFGLMHQLMFAIGRYQEAYHHFELYHQLNDTILNSERTKQFSEREARYQSEKKDVQLQLQQSVIKQKNTLNYILIGSAASLLIISLLSYRNYRHKQKLQQQRINELETEKQLAAAEAVLKGEEQERTRLAKDLHDGLGGMLSGIKYSMNTMKGNLIMTPDNAQAFERSMDMLDSSIKEMRRVAHNLMPEALVKFGLDTALKDFCNDIHQSGALNVSYQSVGMEGKEPDQTTAITIFRIVQELLNNTLKHAAAKNAIVQLNRTDHQLSVTVEDDGKGFNAAVLQHSGGIGWSNIQNRVEFMKGTLDVQSAEGKGTSVHIEINV